MPEIGETSGPAVAVPARSRRSNPASRRSGPVDRESPFLWRRFERARAHWRRHGVSGEGRMVMVGDWTAEQVRTALAMGVRVLIHESAPPEVRKVAWSTLEKGGSLVWLPETERKGRRPRQRLTGAQLRVLKCVSAGLKSADIAKQLGISVRTVETHRHQILRRTGIAAGTPFLRFALSLFPAS